MRKILSFLLENDFHETLFLENRLASITAKITILRISVEFLISKPYLLMFSGVFAIVTLCCSPEFIRILT